MQEIIVQNCLNLSIVKPFKFNVLITQRLNLHKLLVIVYIIGHLHRANRNWSSPTETNAAEAVGTGEQQSCTGISREVGVRDINYLRYDLHCTKCSVRELCRCDARRKLSGDSQAESGEETKSSKVAIVGGQRAGSAENWCILYAK